MTRDPAAVALFAFVLGFAGINGFNDGAAMTASAMKPPGTAPLVSVMVHATAVGVVPVVVGTAVARTFRSGLVDAGDLAPARIVVIGVLAAMVVVGVLAQRGLPTSLTLAVVGGIIGAGAGLGADPRWSVLGRVIAVGIAAPVVGAVIGLLLTRVLVIRSRWALASAHLSGALVQSLAYAANDGQKMIAVAIVAVGVVSGAAEPSVPWALSAGMGACFAIGSAVGLPSASRSLNGGVMPQRPRHEVVVEFASGAAVLGSAALGTPVSMTQSIVGAQVGVGVDHGRRRIRWRVAAHLALAWIVTLPLAGLVGAAAGAITMALNGGGAAG